MIITLKRYNHDSKSTQGLMFLNGFFECHTLEDEDRCVKVHGQTRIPEGEYQIKLRKEDTELTKRYKNKHEWFTWHLQLMNVPGFNWVYIHIGNWDTDTEGCLLVGDVAVNDPNDVSSHIEKSSQAFERLYKQIIDVIDKEEVWIVIESI